MGQGHGMQKTRAVLGSAPFFVVAPCVTAGVIPWWITGWQPHPAFLGLELIRARAWHCGFIRAVCAAGIGDAGAGRTAATSCGDGSLSLRAKSDVVAVITIVIGQALLFGDWHLMVYSVLFWLAVHVFVVQYGEPVLLRTFGAEYERFQANLPRWIPRVMPWERA
jgi:hypothetical protein